MPSSLGRVAPQGPGEVQQALTHLCEFVLRQDLIRPYGFALGHLPQRGRHGIDQRVFCPTSTLPARMSR